MSLTSAATVRGKAFAAVPDRAPRRALPAVQAVFLSGFLGGALIWAYWPTLVTIVERWLNDPQYSHGFLVPIFAGIVLFIRRNKFAQLVGWPSIWGAILLSLAVAFRLGAARVNYDRLDSFSLLVTIAGMVLMVGGWPMLRWAWPAIAFLGFMLPLPFMVEQSLSQPLRRLATVTSTYLLECLGQPAVAEGHTILIDDMQLKVAEACSGLGMLMTFFAMSTAAAMVVNRGWVDRLVLVVSAIPIAVLVNVLRITVTGVTFVWLGASAGQFFMHSVAGWLMPPVALLLLLGEIWLIDLLFPPVYEKTPLKMIPGL